MEEATSILTWLYTYGCRGFFFSYGIFVAVTSAKETLNKNAQEEKEEVYYTECICKYLCSIMIPCPRLDILDSTNFLVYNQHQSLLAQHFMQPLAIIYFIIYLFINNYDLNWYLYFLQVNYLIRSLGISTTRMIISFLPFCIKWNIGENYYFKVTNSLICFI